MRRRCNQSERLVCPLLAVVRAWEQRGADAYALRLPRIPYEPHASGPAFQPPPPQRRARHARGPGGRGPRPPVRGQSAGLRRFRRAARLQLLDEAIGKAIPMSLAISGRSRFRGSTTPGSTRCWKRAGSSALDHRRRLLPRRAPCPRRRREAPVLPRVAPRRRRRAARREHHPRGRRRLPRGDAARAGPLHPASCACPSSSAG